MALTPFLSAAASKAIGALSADSNTYTPIPNNWYQSFPYTFIVTDAVGKLKAFHLPLRPSNINITTHFATNVIATIGGTVEEHAPQRYFDISIAGTTGIAPQNSTEDTAVGPVASLLAKSGFSSEKVGRASYTPEFTLSNGYTGGFFAKTTGALDNALNAARDIIAGNRKHESGFSSAYSGYMAFHNFYRFLLEGKKNLSDGGSSSSVIGKITSAAIGNKGLIPLRFISYKDNQMYTCAILKFELTRSADNPMLYNYSIQLRAYKLSNVDFGSPPPRDRLKDLGLGGDASLLSNIKGKISTAKRGASALGGLGRNFGA
jgi:hypothetical protein